VKQSQNKYKEESTNYDINKDRRQKLIKEIFTNTTTDFFGLFTSYK